LGDGTNTLFWCDPWLDKVFMKGRFSHFFRLADNKTVVVADMFTLDWGRAARLGNDGEDCWHGRKNK